MTEKDGVCVCTMAALQLCVTQDNLKRGVAYRTRTPYGTVCAAMACKRRKAYTLSMRHVYNPLNYVV